MCWLYERKKNVTDFVVQSLELKREEKKKVVGCCAWTELSWNANWIAELTGDNWFIQQNFRIFDMKCDVIRVNVYVCKIESTTLIII